jgi:hypothetical protein
MFTLLVCVAMLLSTPLAVLGAKGAPGPPSGNGGGSGGGSNAGDAAGALYGDLYVIERDGQGMPVTRDVTYPDPETGADVTVACKQPLAEDCGLLPFWGECGLSSLPPGVLPLPACTFDPEAYDPCAVYYTDTDQTYANMLQTVSFGRESVSRSPSSVIDKSYAEALKAINLAVPGLCGELAPAITKDPAGRIVLCLASETEPVTYAWKTIDSPLENMGLYRAVMKDGCFRPIDEEVRGEEGGTIIVTTFLTDAAKAYLFDSSLGHLVCADDSVSETPTKPDMLSGAVFIAAGADKTSPVTLDEIINVNTYLGVNTYTYERNKKNRVLTVTYFPFAVENVWFTYDLGVDACVNPTTWNLLKVVELETPLFTIDPALNVFGATPPGVDLRGANGVAITVCRGGSPLPLGVVCDDPATNPAEAPGITGCGGANWFAQAAEDARKTIWYLHNYEVPELAY